MESQDGSSSSKPAPVRPVNLAEVRRKLSSSGAAHPQLGKVPTSPTSPTLAQAGEQWSSDENKSPVLGSTNATVPNSPPQQHQAPLAAISETDDAGDSDDDEDEGEEEERQHGMKGLYSETAIKYGYLMKKGERRKNWKKRYFVLRANRFGYYKDEKEYKLLRDIPLNEVRTCAMVQVKKHEFSFGIVTAKRTYYCKASSQQEAEDWVAKIDSTAKAVKQHKSLANVNVSREESSEPMSPQEQPKRRSLSGGREPSVQYSTTQPISIGSSTSTNQPIYQTSYPSTSYSSTVSSVAAASSTGPSSPWSPSEALSSSYTSQSNFSSSGAATPSGPPAPPNSLAQPSRRPSQPTDSLPPPIELGGVNTSLSRLSVTEPLSPSRRKMSFGAISNGQTIASSSEDEDEDDEDQFDVTPTGNREARVTFVQHPDPDKVVISGYLTKQGKRKNWRKRWFTLSSQRLSYSKSHMDQKVHRQIPLGRILDVLEVEAPVPGASPRMGRSSSLANINSPEPSTSPNPDGLGLSGFGGNRQLEHCFKIITAKRTFTLCATDEEQEIKWISAIRVLLSASRKSNPPVSPSSLPPAVPNPTETTPAQPQSATQQQKAEIQRPAGNTMDSIDSRIQQAMEGDENRKHARQRSGTTAAKEEVQRLDAQYRLRETSQA